MPSVGLLEALNSLPQKDSGTWSIFNILKFLCCSSLNRFASRNGISPCELGQISLCSLCTCWRVGPLWGPAPFLAELGSPSVELGLESFAFGLEAGRWPVLENEGRARKLGRCRQP